jgi:hypothetical protein
MSIALMERTVSKERSGKRDDKSVKINRDLAVKAKLIAETKGLTIAEYLSGYLRKLIERDWPEAVRKLDDGGAA